MSRLTVISLRVTVPVLSEQMAVTLPRVSTAGGLRMIAWRRAMRETPTARATVMVTDRPSGTMATAVLVAVSPWLVQSSVAIADVTGLGTGFVGTALLAVVTLLPEMVTTLAAVRLGAYDLAVGNLARLERRLFLVEIDALFLILVYSGGLWLLYSRGIGM